MQTGERQSLLKEIKKRLPGLDIKDPFQGDAQKIKALEGSIDQMARARMWREGFKRKNNGKFLPLFVFISISVIVVGLISLFAFSEDLQMNSEVLYDPAYRAISIITILFPIIFMIGAYRLGSTENWKKAKKSVGIALTEIEKENEKILTALKDISEEYGILYPGSEPDAQSIDNDFYTILELLVREHIRWVPMRDINRLTLQDAYICQTSKNIDEEKGDQAASQADKLSTQETNPVIKKLLEMAIANPESRKFKRQQWKLLSSVSFEEFLEIVCLYAGCEQYSTIPNQENKHDRANAIFTFLAHKMVCPLETDAYKIFKTLHQLENAQEVENLAYKLEEIFDDQSLQLLAKNSKGKYEQLTEDKFQNMYHNGRVAINEIAAAMMMANSNPKL